MAASGTCDLCNPFLNLVVPLTFSMDVSVFHAVKKQIPLIGGYKLDIK